MLAATWIDFLSRAYDYLRSKYPAIPYRRIDLSEFPRSSSLGLKIKGKAAYIIVHQGEPIHPNEESLLVPPGQTIWGTRSVSPITGCKILGSDACTMTSEDVLVAHAISLFYEEQREGGYVEREIAALKAEESAWSHQERIKDSRSIRSGRSGISETQTPEKRMFRSLFKPRPRQEEPEKESMVSDRQGRDAVCPWECL